MNDDFLNKFRKPPRQEFANRLYAKISKRSDTMFARNTPVLKRFCLALVVLCIAFVLALAVSPTARAAILGVIQNIGGRAFEEVEQNPYLDESADILPEQIMSLTDAQAVLPFTLSVPGWTPPGFTPQEDNVTVVLPFNNHPLYHVRMQWVNEAEYEFIYLHITYSTVEDYQPKTLVGPESVDEVIVNGQPAALVRGAWNVETQEYDAMNMLDLQWEQDSVYYSLSGVEEAVAVQDLIHMAESMP